MISLEQNAFYKYFFIGIKPYFAYSTFLKYTVRYKKKVTGLLIIIIIFRRFLNNIFLF